MRCFYKNNTFLSAIFIYIIVAATSRQNTSFDKNLSEMRESPAGFMKSTVLRLSAATVNREARRVLFITRCADRSRTWADTNVNNSTCRHRSDLKRKLLERENYCVSDERKIVLLWNKD